MLPLSQHCGFPRSRWDFSAFPPGAARGWHGCGRFSFTPATFYSRECILVSLLSPHPFKLLSKPTTLKVRDFSRACRRSSCSPTFLGFQRCDVPQSRAPSAGELGLHVSALPAQARPRTGAPPAQARPRPGRIPPAPGRAPRAPSASRPPAPPPSRARGWGNRGCRRLLRPLPLARPLPPSSPCCSRFLPLGLSRPVKVLPNFSSPSGLSGRRQRAGCCAPARSAAGPPGSGARGAADTKWPLAVLPPSHLSHPVRPHLLGTPPAGQPRA